jgi:predicted  nucleic acid-binding Zn-ribbon protein
VANEALADYEQLRDQFGGVGIARLEGNHCGGCHLALSAVEVDRVRKLPGDARVVCEECGRLLVR